MIEIKLKLTPQSEKFLKEFPKEFRKGLEEGVKQAAYFVEGQIKKSFGRPGKPKVGKTGYLRQSVKSSYKFGNARLRGILSAGNTRVPYAYILDQGGWIRPRRKKALKFKYKGSWHTVALSYIPHKYEYMMPGIVDNLDDIGKIILDNVEKRSR